MKMKNFDCIKMKHLGAEKIREKIKGMTREQELKFWQERSYELKEQQRGVRNPRENQ